MKRFLTFAGILLSAFHAFPQSYVLSNKSQLNQKNSIYHRPIGQAGSNYMFLNYAEENLMGGFSIERYNEELGFEGDRFFIVPKKQYVLKVFTCDTTIYWVSLYRKGKQKSKLWLNSIGMSMMGSVNSKLALEFEDNSSKVSQFIVEPSNNKSRWAMCWTNSKPKKQDVTRICTAIFDLSANKLKQGESLLEINRLYLDWHSLVLNNRMEMMSILQANEPKDLFSRNSKMNDFYSFSFIDTVEIEKIQFQNQNASNAEDRFPMNIILAVNPLNQEFSLGGLFTDRDFYNQLGYFTFGFDVAKTAWNLNRFIPFESHEILKILGVKRVKANQFPRNYFPRKLIFHSKNKLVLLLEEYTETRQLETYYVNGIPQTSTKILYHYGDIICLVSDSNELNDSCLIVKKDQTANINNLYYLSFGTYVCESAIHLIFNEDIAQNNEVVDVKIQTDLKIVRKSLIDSRNFYNVVIPFDGKEMEYCSFTVPLYREKQWFWAHINGND